MKLIGNYIARQVAAAILLVLAVLLGLDLVAQLIDQSGDLNERYTLAAAFRYTLYSLPGQLLQYLPFAVLIGCLAGLGSLATTSELVVIRAAGISVARILWLALKPALLITLVALLVAEFVAPPLKQRAEGFRAMALQKEEPGISEYGLWHREGNSFIHLNAVQPGGELFGVTIYRLDGERHLSSALFARRAVYRGDHWQLEEVRETRFLEGRTERVVEPARRWDSQLEPDVLDVLVLAPEDLPISGLWRYVSFLRQQSSSSGEYELAFWNKVLQPLAIISLLLVAASIVFGPLRQATMGLRVFIGVLIGIVFRISQDMLGPASLVFGFEPILASLTPILVSLVAGILLLRRRI